MSDHNRKLKLYQKVAGYTALILFVVIALSLLVGVSLPVLILAPLSVLLLLAIIAWIACVLIDRYKMPPAQSMGTEH